MKWILLIFFIFSNLASSKNKKKFAQIAGSRIAFLLMMSLQALQMCQ